MIIEITKTPMVESDMNKVIRLIESNDYGIIEGFVYDYKRNLWRKHHKTHGSMSANPSFCEALQLDFALLLQL